MQLLIQMFGGISVLFFAFFLLNDFKLRTILFPSQEVILHHGILSNGTDSLSLKTPPGAFKVDEIKGSKV